MHPIAAKNDRMHDTVKHTNAHFTFGVKSGRELERYQPGWELIRETSFFTVMRRYSAVGKIGDTFMRKYMNRLAVYKFKR